MLIHIIEDKVAFGIEHLNFVWMCRVETLHRLVGAVGNEFLGRMPCRIDTCREQGIVAHVYLL